MDQIWDAYPGSEITAIYNDLKFYKIIVYTIAKPIMYKIFVYTVVKDVVIYSFCNRDEAIELIKNLSEGLKLKYVLILHHPVEPKLFKNVPYELKNWTSPFNSPKNSPKNSPVNSPMNSPKNSPMNSPMNSPQTSPRNSPKNSPQISPRNSPKNSPRDGQRDRQRKIYRKNSLDTYDAPKKTKENSPELSRKIYRKNSLASPRENSKFKFKKFFSTN